MTTTRKNWKSKVARVADELADLLDLSPVEAQLMKTKAEISSIAVKAIDQSEMTFNEIVKRSGVARSKGIPYQVLIRVFILDGLERLKSAA